MDISYVLNSIVMTVIVPTVGKTQQIIATAILEICIKVNFQFQTSCGKHKTTTEV